ncbi:piercer of microtubule wall 2 protein-like [Nerophis ophidion]|uniref:piercer of microtubule wall 2 protein-like n=1 Tax=Nerophis ophidion TaxID=159077 RepID=UPI002ADFA633|nr:piercer of microtubule wall 2 protein-like [Nerophis ophidion]
MSSSSEKQAENTQACITPGNPVFSCTFNPSFKGPPATPWSKPQNALYRTTSADYGLYPPCAETTACTFHPRTQKFTKHLSRSGMYRDTCFNTTVDRSRVYDCPNLQHTI